MSVVMGDLNAKIGSNNINSYKEEVQGKFGFGVMNDNEERLRDFCGKYEWISCNWSSFPT